MKNIGELCYWAGAVSLIVTMVWVFGICLLLMPGPGTYIDPNFATRLISPAPFIVPFEIAGIMVGMGRIPTDLDMKSEVKE